MSSPSLGSLDAPAVPDAPSTAQWLTSKYGYFDEKAREYVIVNPETPAPWVNYITNGQYHGLVSHAGGGFSFFGSPRDHRITRWRYNGLPFDRPGRYVYARDEDSGAYWSLSWQPTRLRLGAYECRHGLNYTQIKGRCRSIESRLTYFVPAGDNCELWWVRLKNASRRPRRLRLFGYVEFALGHALVDLINQPNDQHFNDVIYLRDRQTLMASKRYWVTYNRATVEQPNQEWPNWVFMGSSLPVRGFDGSRQVFTGPWRSEENPEAIERGACFNTEITAGDAIGCLETFIELAPGGETELVFVMGIVPKTLSGEGPGATARIENLREPSSGGAGPMETRPLPPADRSDEERIREFSRRHDALDLAAANAAERIVKKYRDLTQVKAAFDALRHDLDDYLSAVQVNVPEGPVRALLNCWNQYQVKTTFQFSRDASYYHGGLLFGRGYRDSCQDILGPLMTRPAWARRRILEQAGRQFSSGRCYHLYYPNTRGGENTGHSDTALWLPFAACQYLRETLDFSILEENVPFVDDVPAGEPAPSAPLVEHLERALDYTITRFSPRHLALFGPGDWNDTLDYLGRRGMGESVWVSLFFCYVARDTADLLRRAGRAGSAARFEMWYDRVKRAVNELMWDGRWYRRGTNDDGEVIGSAACEEGKIFVNAQSWAVISGVAEGERAIQCMDSVWEYLRTPKGPKLLHPGYTRVHRGVGLATRCVPGKKENGAVFNHTVSWAVLAEALLGRAPQAWTYYRSAFPMNPVVPPERYEVEPYVYAEYVTSPDHPTFGQASHSWLTGSAVWMLRGALDYMLGVRPEYEGLRVDPCIPASWERYSVRRRFRGATYEIEIENPARVERGVRSITVDGKAVEGQILPDFRDGATHRVRVTLG